MRKRGPKAAASPTSTKVLPIYRRKQEQGAARRERFVIELDAALLSLDEGKIRWVARKWNLDMHHEREKFWPFIHACRMERSTLPMEARRLSFEWLRARGFVKPPDSKPTSQIIEHGSMSIGEALALGRHEELNGKGLVTL